MKINKTFRVQQALILSLLFLLKKRIESIYNLFLSKLFFQLIVILVITNTYNLQAQSFDEVITYNICAGDTVLVEYAPTPPTIMVYPDDCEPQQGFNCNCIERGPQGGYNSNLPIGYRCDYGKHRVTGNEDWICDSRSLCFIPQASTEYKIYFPNDGCCVYDYRVKVIINIECNSYDSPLVDQYPWLNEIIDDNPCKLSSIEVYEDNNEHYILLDLGFGEKLFNSQGERACKESVDCLAELNLTHIVDSWNCDSASPEITGCTNNNAYNYNPEATVDDDSCIFPDLTYRMCEGNQVEIGPFSELASPPGNCILDDIDFVRNIIPSDGVVSETDDYFIVAPTETTVYTIITSPPPVGPGYGEYCNLPNSITEIVVVEVENCQHTVYFNEETTICFGDTALLSGFRTPPRGPDYYGQIIPFCTEVGYTIEPNVGIISDNYDSFEVAPSETTTYTVTIEYVQLDSSAVCLPSYTHKEVITINVEECEECEPGSSPDCPSPFEEYTICKGNSIEVGPFPDPPEAEDQPDEPDGPDGPYGYYGEPGLPACYIPVQNISPANSVVSNTENGYIVSPLVTTTYTYTAYYGQGSSNGCNPGDEISVTFTVYVEECGKCEPGSSPDCPEPMQDYTICEGESVETILFPQPAYAIDYPGGIIGPDGELDPPVPACTTLIGDISPQDGVVSQILDDDHIKYILAPGTTTTYTFTTYFGSSTSSPNCNPGETFSFSFTVFVEECIRGSTLDDPYVIETCPGERIWLSGSDADVPPPPITVIGDVGGPDFRYVDYSIDGPEGNVCKDCYDVLVFPQTTTLYTFTWENRVSDLPRDRESGTGYVLVEVQDCSTEVDLIAPNESLDVKFHVRPTELFREGELDIRVDFYNNGPGYVESVDFIWEINGVVEDITSYNGASVLAGNNVRAILPNYFFEAETDYTIKVTATNINDGVDINPQDNVYEFFLPAFEAAPDLLIKITEPVNPILGSGDIVVDISNAGNAYAYNFVINWSINGDLQTPLTVNNAPWNLFSPNSGSLSHKIGSRGFNPNNNYEIIAWIELLDEDDTDLTNNVTTFNYIADYRAYYSADEVISICKGETLTIGKSYFVYGSGCWICYSKPTNPSWSLNNETIGTSNEITISPTESGLYYFYSDATTDCYAEFCGPGPLGPEPYKADFVERNYGIIVLPCDKSFIGCTDPSAPNYNPDAILDDGSCAAETSICDLPVDSGPCNDDVERFYYDKAEGDCKTFSYGGCEGNSNNFENYFVCMENACVEPIECPEGEPGEWDWIQQRIENSDGCFPGSISAFESGGVTYISTSIGSSDYCPTDYPVDYWSCKGNYICYAGGLTPPWVETGCDFGEITNSRNIWRYSDATSGCTDACAPNYDPDATLDDGSCAAYDTCPDDTCFSKYTWNAEICTCTEAILEYRCGDDNECTEDYMDPETCECVNEPIPDCNKLCNNKPGLMQTASSFVCGGTTIYMQEILSVVNENSVKAYVLHEEKSFNGIDYILMQEDNRFDNPGQDYNNRPLYISAVIGPSGVDGYPKLDDDCTVWAPEGAYVAFLDRIILTKENERCESGQYFVDISVNGGAGGISPNYAYTFIKDANRVYTDVNAGETKTFGPYEGKGNYLIKVKDAKGCSLDYIGAYNCNGLYKVLNPSRENGSYFIAHSNPGVEIKSVKAYSSNGQVVKSNASINGSSCSVEILSNKGIYLVELLLSNDKFDYIKVIK